MAKREYDPLSCIPSVSMIQSRLDAARVQVRRLRILLNTAKRIEQAGRPVGNSQETVHFFDATKQEWEVSELQD